MPDVMIDWASVNWPYVVVLAVIVFFSTLIGMLLAFRRVFPGAVLSAVLFAAGFVFWTYYPHGLPLPTLVTTQKVPVTPAAPAAPAAPTANPDATISPPPSEPPAKSQ
jgi:hypothetical protein